MIKTRRNQAQPSNTHILQIATIAGAALLGAVTEPACAGPTGQTVVVGDVTFTHSGDQMIITASDGSIIDFMG